MIQIGNYNTLKILRSTSVGLFLGDDDVDDLLLPNKYIPDSAQIGEALNVFCYLDHEERPIATTLTPLVIRDGFGLVQVAEVNENGAFVDWGLEKHLLVPFAEQREPMIEGKGYVVYCYLDEKSFRLVGSTKLDKYLSNKELTVKKLDEVSLLFYRKSDLGWDVIVNNQHRGLVFESDVHRTLAIGDILPGYVKNVREDHKLDISLQPIGYDAMEPAAKKIYQRLQEKEGFLDLHDKSDPLVIKEQLQMSKKTFKKGIGILYRDKKIIIKDDGIYLL